MELFIGVIAYIVVLVGMSWVLSCAIRSDRYFFYLLFLFLLSIDIYLAYLSMNLGVGAGLSLFFALLPILIVPVFGFMMAIHLDAKDAKEALRRNREKRTELIDNL